MVHVKGSSPFSCLNANMRDTAIVRFNDHQTIDGIKEYSMEIVLPGTFQTHVIGASQEELLEGVAKAFESILVHFDIPKSVVRPSSKEFVFHDHSGEIQPKSPFAGTAKATFKAEIYRNGVAIEPEEDHIDAPE